MCATTRHPDPGSAKPAFGTPHVYNYDVSRLHTLIRGSKSFNITIIDRLLDPSTIVSYYALTPDAL
jgi:hypothetical protein